MFNVAAVTATHTHIIRQRRRIVAITKEWFAANTAAIFCGNGIVPFAAKQFRKVILLVKASIRSWETENRIIVYSFNHEKSHFLV